MRPFLLPLLCTAASSSAGIHPPLAPSVGAARANAFQIFNDIHSAMRQWGSSINHNGMSVFRGTIPPGTLFSHGSSNGPDPPSSFEWLAFEVEHAEAFAAGTRRPNAPPPAPREEFRGGQARLSRGGSCGAERNGRWCHGYLHTYMATRELNVLYVDGMSAGKTSMGTLDMQDYIIRDLDPDLDYGDPRRRPMGGDGDRAKDLCRFAEGLGFDGIVRLEIGFELIYCDFEKGLRQVSALRQPLIQESEELLYRFLNLYEWARAASARYDGIGGHRVKLDFSSMTSAWFFPLNFTNPDPTRSDLPRLTGLSAEERGILRDQVGKTAGLDAKRIRGFGIDWQNRVVDMIVSRFSDRLATLTRPDCPSDEFASQIIIATNVHVMVPEMVDNAAAWSHEELDREGMEMCSAYYLRPVMLLQDQWTEQDELIYAAVSTVASTICEAFFRIRRLILEVNPLLAAKPQLEASVPDGKLEKAVEEGRAILGDLREKLKWTTWKKCQDCTVDDVCFVAMFPFGTAEDHFSPSCLNWTVLARKTDPVFNRRGYWKFG